MTAAGTGRTSARCEAGCWYPITFPNQLTVKGIHHQRMVKVRDALKLLTEMKFKPRLLLSGGRAINELEEASRSLMRRGVLKIVRQERLRNERRLARR